MNRKTLVAISLLCSSLVLTGCVTGQPTEATNQPDTSVEAPPTEKVVEDPMEKIKVLSVKCEEWPGHAQVLIQNKNPDMYGVGVTIAFIHEDGTVAATESEYPNLLGNAKTRLVVKRPDEISFSTCKLADIYLLQPSD